uniref:Chorismate lyase n=1 Tax=Compsopogon caeruleus TaxID=31354 RepID=A0A1Z1XB22_9RHOD|nr:hypothetical protein [Compsopogon caeruleus]ARX96055.1 hypothetical protein [Compsopogon caeruleus]
MYILKPNSIYNLLLPILMVSDGSLTRQLEILTQSSIQTLYTLNSDISCSNAKKDLFCNVIREIYLINRDGDKLVYAVSWWISNIHIHNIDYIINNIPIGKYFIENRIDFYKDIISIHLLYSDNYRTIFFKQGPYWSRYYLLYLDKQAVAIFLEIFSPKLLDYFY